MRRARALLVVVSKRLETAELNFKAARLRVARIEAEIAALSAAPLQSSPGPPGAPAFAAVAFSRRMAVARIGELTRLRAQAEVECDRRREEVRRFLKRRTALEAMI